MKFNIGKYVLSVGKNTIVIDDHKEIQQTILDSIKIMATDETRRKIRTKLALDTAELPTLTLTVSNCVLASKIVSDSNILAVRTDYDFDVFKSNILKIYGDFDIDKTELIIYDIFYDATKMETYIKIANKQAVMDLITASCNLICRTNYFDQLIISLISEFKYEEDLDDMFILFNKRLDAKMEEVGYAFNALDVVYQQKVRDNVAENLKHYIEDTLKITNFDPDLLTVNISCETDNKDHLHLLFSVNYEK